MNTGLRNVLVSSSLVLLIWTGCSGDDGDETTTTTAASSSSGPTSTGSGTASSSTGGPASSSVGPSSSSGAGASGPGCDDIPAFPPGPSNGECIPGYEAGSGGGGGAGGAMGGGAPIEFAECNPISQEGCNFAGGAECDIEASGNFQCFPSGNTEPPCAACDNANGPWCQPGLHCDNGACRRYCCDDGDCGPSLTCDKTVPTFENLPGQPVGLCLP